MTDVYGDDQPGTLACSDWGPKIGGDHGQWATSQRRARNLLIRGGELSNGWVLNWATQVMTNTAGNTVIGTASPNTDQWLEIAETVARSVCRAQHGGQAVSNVAIGRGHNRVVGNTDQSNLDFTGEHLGWFHHDLNNGPAYSHRARQSRSWTATCKKTIRRTRK